MPGNAKSGRKKVPAGVKLLKGTFRKDQHPPDVDTSAKGRPTYKPKSNYERWMWGQIKALPWLKSADSSAARALCEAWHNLQTAQVAMRADMSDAKARNAYATHFASWYKLAGDFGLTPADRTRIGKDQAPDPQSELEKFLAGGTG